MFRERQKYWKNQYVSIHFRIKNLRVIGLCLTPVGKTFYAKICVKGKDFIPISFDDSTGTQ